MASVLRVLRERVIDSMGDDHQSPSLFVDPMLVDRWVIEGYRETGRVRPKRATTSIVLEANQNRYDPPDDVISVDGLFYRPSGDVGGEVAIDVVYDPYVGKIVIVGSIDLIAIPSGTSVTLYYSTFYAEPSENSAGDMPDRLEDAVVEYACAKAANWMILKHATANKGVVSFVRGRYEEKGGDIAKSLRSVADGHMSEWAKISGSQDPALSFSQGQADRPASEPRRPLSGAVVGDRGVRGYAHGLGPGTWVAGSEDS